MKTNTKRILLFFNLCLLFFNAFPENLVTQIKDSNSGATVVDGSFETVLNLFGNVKQELKLEKDNVQLFEENLLLLSNILINSDLSKSQMIKQFFEYTGKLNSLLEDEKLFSSLDDGFKEKVLELEKLIDLFIKIRDLDLSELSVDFSSISSAIYSINLFLIEKDERDRERAEELVEDLPLRSFDSFGDDNIDIEVEPMKQGIELKLDEFGNIEEFPFDNRSLIEKAGDFVVDNKESIVKASSGVLKDIMRGGLVFGGIRRILKRI